MGVGNASLTVTHKCTYVCKSGRLTLLQDATVSSCCTDFTPAHARFHEDRLCNSNRRFCTCNTAWQPETNGRGRKTRGLCFFLVWVSWQPSWSSFLLRMYVFDILQIYSGCSVTNQLQSPDYGLHPLGPLLLRTAPSSTPLTTGCAHLHSCVNGLHLLAPILLRTATTCTPLTTDCNHLTPCTTGLAPTSRQDVLSSKARTFVIAAVTALHLVMI